MKEVQPHGPYNLVGMCEGALISFEMARMLRAAGEKVDLLGMIDAWPIENTRRYYLTKDRCPIGAAWSNRGARSRHAAPNERAASVRSGC